MPESPYRWLHRLGSGSAGAVWAAERDGRLVAVKVLHNNNQPAMAETLRREMAIGPIIANHPNVVAVRRVEEVGGTVHLEMDLVPGPSLAQVLEGRIAARRGAVPTSIAVAWAIEVLDALAFVGRAVAPRDPRSFCHRDIKPANLLLDPSGKVRVTDFGVARATAELGFQTTATGIVKGSPRFMAPEVITERAPDARADQFSTAAVLFELITGMALYEGRDLPAVILLAVNADVERRLKLLRGSPELAAVLRRMLAKSADDRFPSPDAAAAALSALRIEGPDIRELLDEFMAYRNEGEDLQPDSDPGQSTRELLLDEPEDTDSGARRRPMFSGGASTVDVHHRGNALPTFLPADEQPTRTSMGAVVGFGEGHDVTSELAEATPALDELPGPPLTMRPGTQSEPTAEPTPRPEDHKTETPDALRLGPSAARPEPLVQRRLTIPKPRGSADDVPTAVMSVGALGNASELPTQVMRAGDIDAELRRLAADVSTVEAPGVKVAPRAVVTRAPASTAPAYETWLVVGASAVFVIATGGTFGVVLVGLWLSSR